jgi:hypothetical protein
MNSKSAPQTAILCATGLIAFGLVVYALDLTHATGTAMVWALAVPMIGVGLVAWSRYLIARKRVEIDLAGGDQYRRLADEYRRLADMAITAQEHTDLKLGDLSVQLDYLREQSESLQKILKEVE